MEQHPRAYFHPCASTEQQQQQLQQQQQHQQRGPLGLSLGAWSEWSEDEQQLLQQLLQLEAPEQQRSGSVERCLRIAASLPHKTARDVALRLRWMSINAQQQQQQQQGPESAATLLPLHRPTKPRSRRKGSRQSSFRISQATKDMSSEGEQASEGDDSCGPQPIPASKAQNCQGPHTCSCSLPFPHQHQHQQQGLRGKAGTGSSSSEQDWQADAGVAAITNLMNQNYSILASFKANMEQCKVVENTELLLQYRDNMMAALESMAAMPGVTSKMPPLPVQPKLEMAARILPPRKPHGLGHMPQALGACMSSGCPPSSLGMACMPLLPPPPSPPPNLHELPPPPFPDMPLPLPSQPLGLGGGGGMGTMPPPHHDMAGFPAFPQQPGVPPSPSAAAAMAVTSMAAAGASPPPAFGPLHHQQHQQRRHLVPVHHPHGAQRHASTGVETCWAGSMSFPPPTPPFAAHLPQQRSPPPHAHPSPHHPMLPPNPPPAHPHSASPSLPSPTHAPYSPLHAQAPGSPLHPEHPQQDHPPAAPHMVAHLPHALQQRQPSPPLQQQQQQQQQQQGPRGQQGAASPLHPPSMHPGLNESSPPPGLPSYSSAPPPLAPSHSPPPALAFHSHHYHQHSAAAAAAPHPFSGALDQPGGFPNHHLSASTSDSFPLAHAAAHPFHLRQSLTPLGHPFGPPHPQPNHPAPPLPASAPLAEGVLSMSVSAAGLLSQPGAGGGGRAQAAAAPAGNGAPTAALLHPQDGAFGHSQAAGAPSSSLEDYITTPSNCSNPCSAGQGAGEGSGKSSVEGGLSTEQAGLQGGSNGAMPMAAAAAGAADSAQGPAPEEQPPPLQRCQGCPPDRVGSCVARRLLQQQQQMHVALVQQQAQHFLRHDLLHAVQQRAPHAAPEHHHSPLLHAVQLPQRGPQQQQQQQDPQEHHDPLLLDALYAPSGDLQAVPCDTIDGDAPLQALGPQEGSAYGVGHNNSLGAEFP